MTPETPIRLAVHRWVGSRPWARVWRQQAGVFLTPDGKRLVSSGRRGAADLTGILRDGRRLEIEVKASGRKPTKPRTRTERAQSTYRAVIERFNGVYLLVDSVDDCREQLAALGYRDG